MFINWQLELRRETHRDVLTSGHTLSKTVKHGKKKKSSVLIYEGIIVTVLCPKVYWHITFNGRQVELKGIACISYLFWLSINVSHVGIIFPSREVILLSFYGIFQAQLEHSENQHKLLNSNSVDFLLQVIMYRQPKVYNEIAPHIQRKLSKQN